MKLSIVYYLTEFNNTLKQSIESLHKIDNKSIELVLFHYHMDKEMFKFISALNFKNIKVKKFNIFQNVGHSYAYNLSLKYCEGEYIYFSSSRSVFSKNFWILFNNELRTKKLVDVFYVLDSNDVSRKKTEEIFLRELSLKYFIFNRNFLLKNDLYFVCYHHYHTLFICESILKSKKIANVSYNISDHSQSYKYYYNIYDILASSEKLFEKISKSSTISDYDRELMFASISISILYEFLFKITKNKISDDATISAINNAYSMIMNLLPNFKKNTFLLKNKNNKICEYILNFTPELKKVEKGLKNAC